MKAHFVKRHTENLAKDVVSFWFEPEKPLDQIAGQYIVLTLPHPDTDDRGDTRWFTLSSPPTSAPLISITTRFADHRGSSFKKALYGLKPGDTVNVSDPMGDFVLPKDSDIPLVFVAGGIGITPFHSIVAWLHDTKQMRDITAILGVSNEYELVFQDLFEHYGLERTIVVNKPKGAWDGETGKLSGKRIIELAKPADNALIYVSGPESMVEALNKELGELGIAKHRLVGDFFPGYSEV